MIAKQLVTEPYIPLNPLDSGAYALSQMEEFGVSHLPVVNNTEYLGLISASDIQSVNDPDRIIGDCGIKLNRSSISDNQHIYDVIRSFSGLKVTALPVLNSKGRYLGLITQSTLLQHLDTFAAVNFPGGVLVLELNEKDYNLVEIAKIVESNDNKILSLYVTSFPESTKIEVTLKLDRMDIGPVLQTFFRYNYLVKASWSDEDSYNQALQERFDGLMNYLSI